MQGLPCPLDTFLVGFFCVYVFFFLFCQSVAKPTKMSLEIFLCETLSSNLHVFLFSGIQKWGMLVIQSPSSLSHQQ